MDQTEIGRIAMFVLGRRDRLEPQVTLAELFVTSDDDGKPLRMPRVSERCVVVCGMTHRDGAERLTVCKSLYEMKIEYAFFVGHFASCINLSWYVAEKNECDAVLSSQAANAV